MDFTEKIRELRARIPKQIELIQTEEATKHAFVMLGLFFRLHRLVFIKEIL